MLLTTHAAAGILISRYVHDPAAVFGLSFASHFVLDFIPHGDEHLFHDEEWQVQKRYRRPILINLVDLTGLVILILWSINRPGETASKLMVIGIIGAILPDFLSFLFPVIHQRFSWLFLMRWLYAITKPTGLRYLIRGQNWIHRVLHHDLIRRDIPFWAGLSMQVAMVAAFMVFGR
ncbi:MAG: hypothetical protein AAB619_02865 [Patescibacteria group bacterium]